jgi:hypothetical protein
MARKRTTRSGRSAAGRKRRGKRSSPPAGRKRRGQRSSAPRRRAAAARPARPAGADPERDRERPGRRPEPEQTRSRAFIAEARDATDALAEELGESFVLSATSGEDSEEHYERERPEEEGGPFLETSGKTEFAYGVDESNPEDAEPAPWPTVSLQGRRAYRPGGPR